MHCAPAKVSSGGHAARPRWRVEPYINQRALYDGRRRHDRNASVANRTASGGPLLGASHIGQPTLQPREIQQSRRLVRPMRCIPPDLHPRRSLVRCQVPRQSICWCSRVRAGANFTFSGCRGIGRTHRGLCAPSKSSSASPTSFTASGSEHAALDQRVGHFRQRHLWAEWLKDEQPRFFVFSSMTNRPFVLGRSCSGR